LYIQRFQLTSINDTKFIYNFTSCPLQTDKFFRHAEFKLALLKVI